MLGFTLPSFCAEVLEGSLASAPALDTLTRVVVEVTVTADGDRTGQVLIVDPIPAGYEIENPDVSASGETEAFDWLDGIIRDAELEEHKELSAEQSDSNKRLFAARLDTLKKRISAPARKLKM